MRKLLFKRRNMRKERTSIITPICASLVPGIQKSHYSGKALQCWIYSGCSPFCPWYASYTLWAGGTDEEITTSVLCQLQISPFLGNPLLHVKGCFKVPLCSSGGWTSAQAWVQPSENIAWFTPCDLCPLEQMFGYNPAVNLKVQSELCFRLPV